jgi:O-succinylbenzoic acid--CoA ligase
MHSWLHLATARHPDRIAVEAPGRRLTYAELSERAAGGARALEALEVCGGARVGLAVADPVEFVVALHACLLVGAPAVPIDLRLAAEEQALRTADTRIVVREPLGAGPRRIRRASVAAPVGVALEAVAAVMHTSGTTAAPKPVELSYRNFLASALGSAVALGLDPDERWLSPMPLTHVGGLAIPIRSSIYATTAVLHSRFDTEAVLGELMNPARRITIVSLVPTMLARLLDAGLERPPTLRWALLGGAPIPPALLAKAQEARVRVAPTYGMTETCSQIATFGWPLPGAEIRTSSGEVVVRGPMVSAGGLADDGWLHTGDLGRFDERSRLQITGRKSDTIVSGGENIAPAEIEAVLLEHPSVADAGVFARPDPEWGEAVVAAVVAREGSPVASEELRAFCASRLASFKVPKAVEFRQTLPRTVSGKLLRRELA